MKLNNRISAAMVAALLTGTALSGPLMAQTLTIGVRAGPDSMDPHYSTLGSHIESLRHIFESVLTPDETLQLKPGLAESWSAIDDTTWEFKLRKGVKFHDGSEMTAKDVKFSIERIPAAAGPMNMSIYIKHVAEAIVVDDYTLHVKTKAPAPTLPNDFIRVFVVPASIGDEARNEEFNSGKAAIGTGPYKLKAWEPKGDLVLERNDDYWGDKPEWETVIRKEIPADPARLAALKSGQVDIINYVPATDYLSLKNDNTIETIAADAVYIFQVIPNVKDTLPMKAKVNGVEIDANPLADQRVRAALDYAINREALVDVVLEGLGVPANQSMPKGFFGFSDAIPPKAYDVAKAKELLAEAGYPNGFELDFFCTSNRQPGDTAVCEALAQMWARAGVKINPNAVNGTVFFPAQQAGEYSLWMSAWGTLSGEAGYTYPALMYTNTPEKGMGAFNKSGYSNPELDAIIDKAYSNMNDDERRALYEQASELAMEDRALLPIVQLQTVTAAKAGKFEITTRLDQETLAYDIFSKK